MKKWWMLAALGVAVASCESSNEWSVSSPDGEVAVEVELTDAGEITYAVAFNGEEVIADSKLGFDFANADDFLDGFELHNQRIIHKQVDAVTAIDLRTLIYNMQWHLYLEGNRSQRKLSRQALFIGRLQ